MSGYYYECKVCGSEDSKHLCYGQAGATKSRTPNAKSESPTVSEDKTETDNSPYIDDKLVNEWMLSQGFKWYTTDQKGKVRTFFDGYWNIDHPNGTHESVTQLVARRFYALIHRVTNRDGQGETPLQTPRAGASLEIKVAPETMQAVMGRIKLKDKTIADRVLEPVWRIEAWREGTADTYDLEVEQWKLRILANLTRRFNWAVFLLKPENLAGVVGSRNPTQTSRDTKGDSK